MKSEPRGKAIWNANGGFVSVLLTHLFLSFFGFFAKATGRTVRPTWTNEGSKRIDPLKEVPFGGTNDVPLNFGSKIPQKLKFWGCE